MTSYPCNKYEQITPSYLLSVKQVPISMHYFSSSRCMPIFISVGRVVLLVCTKSALIMPFPAQTMNKKPLQVSGIISEIKPKVSLLCFVKKEYLLLGHPMVPGN